jgi:hypothetical protein
VRSPSDRAGCENARLAVPQEARLEMTPYRFRAILKELLEGFDDPLDRRIIIAVFGGHLRKHGRFGEWKEIVKLCEALPTPE